MNSKNLPILTQHENNSVDKNDGRHGLYEYWQKNIKIIDELIKTEFNKLKNPTEYPMTEAGKQCNYPKSKYKNIYPFDYNRVKLSPFAGVEGSDFINASYIQTDYHRTFIAAQAPTQVTIGDFYKMIYENQIKVIVMLTLFKDKEKLNCVPYWNDDGTFECGIFRLTLKTIEKDLAYVKRVFSLTNIEYPEYEQSITHYHYTKWPDKSTPDETSSIIELINCVNSHDFNSKILVHCSAGVGRTGTYIILDGLLQMIKEKKQIEIATITNYIIEMRRQRVYFVQTMEQYKFIVLAILESYVFGNTKINIKNCEQVVSDLKLKRANGESLMEIEFKSINTFKDKQRTTKKFENDRTKFISEKFKPYDEAMVSLEKTNLNDELSRSVDAVFFMTSQIPVEFITASYPIESYFEDIARITLRLQPVVIISLSTNSYLPQLNEEKIVNNRYTIQNRKMHDKNGIHFHELHFNTAKVREEGFNVYYIEHAKNWNERNIPQDTELFMRVIDCVLDITEKYRMNNNSKLDPLVLIHSTYTGDRCAEFVACSVLLHTIRTYKWFNVCQTVNWLRKYRENVISELVNYDYLYKFSCEAAKKI